MAKSGFWSNKRVFITGINGFIGGNLSKALVERGASVVGLERNLRKDTFLFFEGLDRKVTLIEGELIDKELLTRIVSEERIQVVFHLAAQVEVGVARVNPYLTNETNIRGTYGLMDAVRVGGEDVEAVVTASSDKAYGSYPLKKMPYREDYPLIPVYPYDVSKACADMICRSYASDLYKLPVVVTRFSNIFGPGQLNFSALVPDAVRSALGYSTFIPRGDGSQVRDYIYVEDVADLYLRIAEGLAKDPKRFSGEVFNAGNKEPIPVREVLRAVYRLIGNEPDLRKVEKLMRGKKTVGEIPFQYMDYSKPKKWVGWKPAHSFEQGLEKTVRWFEDYLKRV